MGGQTGLNTSLALDDMGVLEKFNVEMIGAKREAIEMAEDRKLFREAMDRLGIENPKATIVTAPYADDPAKRAWPRIQGNDRSKILEEGERLALEALEEIGLPAVIRPAFTMGGTGGGVAYNREEYIHYCRTGMDASPVAQISWMRACSVGKNMRWKLYATKPTMPLSFVPLKTLIRWACIPAIQSLSPLPLR